MLAQDLHLRQMLILVSCLLCDSKLILLFIVIIFPVYPPGSMLEMSNGYQASSSPALVNSPSSPGQLVMSPSPTPKALNASNRATPPPRHHSPRPNLRIVMPNAPSHHEDNNVIIIFIIFTIYIFLINLKTRRVNIFFCIPDKLY